MSSKIAFIMDAPEFIQADHDSTVALITEAKKRGYDVSQFQQKDLVLRDDKLFFNDIPVVEYKFIFMRKDPPVDQEYLYTTIMLDLAVKQCVKVINNPQALRDCNEKLFISWFPQCCPPTLTTFNSQLIHDFLNRHKEIILKPLNGMGGQGIQLVSADDKDVIAVIEAATKHDTVRVMAQKYLPEIKNGDKRIIMMHGKPLPYALSRFAKPGEIRANLAAGGSYQKAELTERDKFICSQVGPVLKEKGLLFVGLDVIGDYLTEINVTSPTCLREIDKLFGVNTAGYLFDGL
ncbi:MAG: glutathione synthase [Gammaproteobacteria bacterium]|nr:glutathione synthase [Gammaproteobacteria bacterium]